MATLTFRGDAQPRRQQTVIVPANLEIGDTLTLTINRKDVSYTIVENPNAEPPIVPGVSQAELVNYAIAGLLQAMGAVDQLASIQGMIPEFSELVGGRYRAIPAPLPGLPDRTIATAIRLIGPANGKPFEITASTSDAGNFGVQVVTLQEGVPATNEIQRIRLPGPPTGGTFTLTFSGQTTGNLDYNETAGDIEDALEALSNIDPGDVEVTGNAPDFVVEFKGDYEGVNVPQMTGNGTSLTGNGQVVIQTVQDGATGINEIQRIVGKYVFNGTGRLKFGGQQTGLIHPNMSAAEIQSALEALSTIGVGNVLVERVIGSSPGIPYLITSEDPNWQGELFGFPESQYRVTFVGSLAHQNVGPIEAVTPPTESVFSSPWSMNPVVQQEGSAVGINELQTVTILNQPSGGTFTLTFSGQTTAGIAYNASAGNVQSALEALSNLDPGDVSVSRSGSGTLSSPFIYTVEFAGTLAETDVSQLTANASSLTGGAVNVSTIQQSFAGINEQQQITLLGSPTSGDFDLTWNSETAIDIAYNASASAIQSALEGLTTPGPGDFAVSGPAGGPWLVEFTGSYAKTNVSQITGNGSDLAGSGTQTLTVESPNEVEPTGPNWWNEPENWSTGNNPANGDIVILKDGNTPIRYGLEELAGVTLAELHIDLSYTGNIGLADQDENLYYQYRPKYLKQPATLVFIGEGQGPGNNLTRLDTAEVQTTILQYGSGRPQDSSLPAVQWIGTHASNVARIFRGSFGAAVEAGTAAVLATFQVGYQTDRDSDVEFSIGPGCNLDDVAMSGGSGDIDLSTHAAGDIVMTGGTLRLLGDNAVDLVQLSGESYLYYNTTGALGGVPVVTDQATLDFSQDMRAKTVTNPIEVYSPEAKVIDPFKVVSGLIVDFNFMGVQANGSEWGSNVRLTRGVPA